MKQKNSNHRILLFLLLILPCFVFAQNTLSGTVSDEKGDTVPFANVIEKGTSNGVTTDMEGNFTIEVPNLPVTLVFSSIGYETVEQEVSNTMPINITMPESTEALEEVVITGLATSIKRSNAANAVATISAEELIGRTPAQTLDGALSGKFPGVTVTSSSGSPGGGISIRLRGITSINGNSQPLYIIDGVYIDNSSIFSGGLNDVSNAAWRWCERK